MESKAIYLLRFFVWGTMTAVTLYGVVIKGAYHHILTLLVSWGFLKNYIREFRGLYGRKAR